MFRKIVIVVLLASVLLMLSGCFAGSKDEDDRPAGLFLGIWHGWIAPLGLVLEIFNSEIQIYESNNRGFLYDLGFYMAIISGFGGLSLFRRSRKRD
ncbi:MAG: hypothetical protein P9L91_01230 [Candidatus Zophobacter franzmannii]|nr:hypothetical protein [Candidatus Zophobacter franzmannii]